MALRVGVTGHRWNKLRPSAAAALAQALATAFAAIDREHSEVILLTGMAEGTDLLAADVRPGTWQLEPVLALPLAAWRDHLRDISHDLALFDRLIARAKDPVTAPLQDRPDFQFVGDHIARRSDHLVAVWDGIAGKPGGTGDVVEKARLRGIPVQVIWQEHWSPQFGARA